MKNFQVGKLTLDPRDLAILKCLQSDLPLIVLVDREGRIAISHAGVVDPFVFEADINALLGALYFRLLSRATK